MDISKIKNKYSHTLYDNAIKTRLAYFTRIRDDLKAHKAKAENILLKKKDDRHPEETQLSIRIRWN